MPATCASDAVVGLSATRYRAPDCKARLPLTVMKEPGVPVPGAKVAPETVRSVTVPEPVKMPPLTFAPPFNAPLLVVVPAVLVRSPDRVAPTLLLNVPAFETVPVQVRLLVMVPVLEATLPIQMPLLVIVAALLSRLPVHVPVAALVMLPIPVLLATLARYAPALLTSPALF